MTRLARRRPSAAMIVGCVALSFALAGSAVAGTDAVTSRLDKKEKKQVKKIAKKQANKQIRKKESGLRVEHARQADHASTATNATNATNAVNAEKALSINGASLARFAYNVNSTSTPTTILNAGGLRLIADCTGADLNVIADTTVGNSMLGSYAVDTSAGPPPTVENGIDEEPFDPGDNIDLLFEDDAGVVGTTGFISGNGTNTVQVSWTAENDVGNFDCNFTGSAVVG